MGTLRRGKSAQHNVRPVSSNMPGGMADGVAARQERSSYRKLEKLLWRVEDRLSRRSTSPPKRSWLCVAPAGTNSSPHPMPCNKAGGALSGNAITTNNDQLRNIELWKNYSELRASGTTVHV